MLPGQLGILIIGIISAIALAILGTFSFLKHKNEKQQAPQTPPAAPKQQSAPSATPQPAPKPAPKHNDFGFKF